MRLALPVGTVQPADLESAREALVGHYAHYDVVAYEDTTTRTTMRTLIISYGFTDFYLKDGKLMASDCWDGNFRPFKFNRFHQRSW